MTLTGIDITGGNGKSCKYCGGDPSMCGHCRICGALGTCAHSSLNPRNNRIEPTLVEKFINKVGSRPNPPEKEFFIGDRPTDETAVMEGVIDRKSIVLEAMSLTNRVSQEILTRISDAMFNNGVSMEELQKIAAMDSSDSTLETAYEILDNAKLLEGRVIPVEHTEGVIAIARAILRYIMTHHGQNFNVGRFQYEPTIKTPFMAWRIKEAIQEHLLKSEPILVNPQGHDSKRQCEEFYASFKITDIVLWDCDIWKAAIRGSQEFTGTKVGEDVVSSITPMFWQFNKHTFLKPLLTNRERNEYECVGFVLLPHREDFVELTIPDSPGVKFNPDSEGSQSGKIILDEDVPEVREAIQDGITRAKAGEFAFSKYGISIGIIYLPIRKATPMTPEIRFMEPIYEDDIIKDELTAIMVAAAKFLTLKYVAKDDVQVSKKELKADRPLFKKVRHGKTQVPPIKVINLRRPEKRERTEDEAKTDSKRHYSCWFVVDAHWRKQLYPSRNRYEVIRILAYPKGDFTKPFKPSREKVFKAVR